MRTYTKTLASALLAVVMLALFGCGGSGSSTTTDPFYKAPTDTGANQPIFNNISTATGKIALTVATDVQTVDVDNGQVLVTAKVKAGDAPVAGMPVTFQILTPATLATIQTATVNTDSNGSAVTRITTGHTDSTTNVLLSATITVGGQPVTANTSFQLVRGGGVIMFTDKAGLTGGGQTNVYPLMSMTVPAGTWSYLQLIPFKLTDANGNPRVGVPVTLSVYSITSNDPSDVLIDFLVNPVTEPNQQTITTDSAGQGIFNTRVSIGTVAAGQTVSLNVVYKAVTNDAIPVSAYLGTPYSMTGEKASTTTTP